MTSLVILLLILPTSMSAYIATICPSLPPCNCSRENSRYYFVCSSVSDVSTLAAAIPHVGHDDLPWVQIINSNIPSLKPRAFGSLRAQGLQINESNLTNISSDAFIGLEDLRSLVLQDNALKSIPSAALRRLINVKQVSFAGNRISYVSNKDFIKLTELYYLSLSENFIDQIEPGAFPMSIVHLAVNSNRLGSLKDIFTTDLPRLQWLLLANNSLRTLHAHDFEALPSLRMITLTHNLLVNIGGAFEQLPELRTLLLSDNRLRTLEGVFSFMAELEEVAVSQNLLTSVSYLGDLPMLNTLDLSQNKINRIHLDAFEKTPRITKLNLSDNSIEHFPADALSPLGSLVHLDLSRNRLETLTEIMQLKLPMLKHLYISGNKLTTLPDKLFESFPSLQELDATFNLLVTLDVDEIIALPLRSLHLQGNPLKCDLSTLKVFELMADQIDDKPRCVNAVLPDSQEEK